MMALGILLIGWSPLIVFGIYLAAELLARKYDGR
jgi:hypothetical protein